MNLFARFLAIKNKVGGNHEKRQYEMTMGYTLHEKHRITAPAPHNRRILSEVNFALQLSKRNGNCYDSHIAAALDVLEASMAAEGVLTRTACIEAERCLLPLAEAAKAYEVLYVAHAHIDMNWMWGWHETVAVTLSTFRTMLNLMKEYPQFTFSQSQASTYKIVEEHDPDMMQEILARIAEGRWEVTANAWVETDKNMPDTESLLRHIRVTRDYLRDVWGVTDVKVDFSPDTFGHSRFVPEINTFGNVPYYYHCRGLNDDIVLYRYRAPSGAEILMYKEPYWYNSGINPDNGTGVFEMEQRCAGLKTALVVYGVGNHGGGPSRRDIETMLEMQQWPIFPTLKFSTLHEFFRKAESVREQLPLIDHELNVLFTGCYTTQSRIKLGNRRTEAALLDSERMSALAHASLGTEFPHKRYEKAWQNVLFTHFHDILTGSGVQETREHAMGKYSEALAYAQSEQAKALEKLSHNIDTSMFPCDDCIGDTIAEGAGAGFGVHNYAGVPNPERGAGKTRIYTVFNASPVQRKELAELTIWDYSGDLDRIEVLDHEGNIVRHQLCDLEPVHYWDHRFVRVLIQTDVPPMGYATYVVREKAIDDYPTYTQLSEPREELPKGPILLENDRICARLDTGSGMLLSLVNKSTGEELLSAPAGLHLVRTEDAGMTAWSIGRYLGMEPVTHTSRVRIREGALRKTVIFDQKVMDSTVYMEISLDHDSDALRYKLSVDWHEVRSRQDFIPLLSYRLPLKAGAQEILTDVPAGTVTRPACELDVPALTGACAAVSGTTAALITDCKYGFRLADNVLSVTLINTACDPDLYPERGIHEIQLFVALSPADATHLKRTAETLIRPLTAVPTASHRGQMPAKTSLMGFEAAPCVMTSAQIATDGALTIRLYEAAGTTDSVTIVPLFPPARAVLTDLDENVLCHASISDGTVKFAVAPHKIVQVKIYR